MADKNREMANRIAREVEALGGRSFYVGGLVRDKLMGIDNKDIDIEIHGISPEQLMGILDKLGHRTEMGASFGIFGLKGYDLDIAMPRKEEATGRGHKDFAVFVDPFLGTEKAAKRRDFTMNALMEDVLTGEIIDHFGGQQDLKDGILRHVNADTFVEDPLRVLRAAQFAARFEFRIADETIALARTMDLSYLAQERIMGELEKALLKADRPSVFFEKMDRMHQLEGWFPEVLALRGVEQDPKWHPEGDVWTHTMLVLDAAAHLRGRSTYPLAFMMSALTHDFGKVLVTEHCDDGRIRSILHEKEGLPLVKKFVSRLTKEVKLTKYILNMTELHMRPNAMAAQNSGQKAMNHLYDESICPADLILLSEADHNGRVEPEDYSATETFLREKLEVFEEMMARPYVMGADLVAAGFKPGNYFSKALEYAHKLRLAGVDKESALKQTISFIRKEEGGGR